MLDSIVILTQKIFNNCVYAVLACWFFFGTASVWAQQTLLLQGLESQETYTVINEKLADVGDAFEISDCSHSKFGPYITQVFDKALKKHVFRFHIHRDKDTDRCKNSIVKELKSKYTIS